MHHLLYIHWDQDPSIFGFLSWYGLLFATSFAVGYWIMARMLKKEGLPERWLDSLTIYMGLSTVIGARLGHCLFYDPAFYLTHPWEILMIWEGGLASHGAAVGIIFGLWLWSRKVSRRHVLYILDRIVIMVALSGLFIRTGNLMNSEILGDPTTSSLGVVFPRADQADNFKAKWQKQDVDIQYTPPAMPHQYFAILRVLGDTVVTEIQNGRVTQNAEGIRTFNLRDNAVGDQQPINYLAVGRNQPSINAIPLRDSTDDTTVSLQHELPYPGIQFTGNWEGQKLHLRFAMTQASQASVYPILLLESADSIHWTIRARGTLGGDQALQTLDTLITPAPGKHLTYRILPKEQEIRLVARHPSMMYEAFAYTLIFAFLLWFYYHKDAKIERGLFFGLFLVLTFGARIAIEYLKENQEMFDLGLPLNMGQLLSVPFVLAGFVFIALALRRGYQPEPPPVLPPAKPQN